MNAYGSRLFCTVLNDIRIKEGKTFKIDYCLTDKERNRNVTISGQNLYEIIIITESKDEANNVRELILASLSVIDNDDYMHLGIKNLYKISPKEEFIEFGNKDDEDASISSIGISQYLFNSCLHTASEIATLASFDRGLEYAIYKYTSSIKLCIVDPMDLEPGFEVLCYNKPSTYYMVLQ